MNFSKQEGRPGSLGLIIVDNQVVVILCDFGMAFGLCLAYQKQQ
jgi:hypothetical protein